MQISVLKKPDLILVSVFYRPLNTIGLPYYDSQLLSSWTPHFLPHPSSLYYPPPVKIPPQITSTMKTKDNVAYAPLPKELKGRRNMVSTGRRDQGRFRSGRKGDDVSITQWYKMTFANLAQPEPDTPIFDPSEIPRLYRKVEIEYSKFGVEDFDFGLV